MKHQIERNYLPEITKENSNKELNLSLLTSYNSILSLLRPHYSIFKSLKSVKPRKQAVTSFDIKVQGLEYTFSTRIYRYLLFLGTIFIVNPYCSKSWLRLQKMVQSFNLPLTAVVSRPTEFSIIFRPRNIRLLLQSQSKPNTKIRTQTSGI